MVHGLDKKISKKIIHYCKFHRYNLILNDLKPNN